MTVFRKIKIITTVDGTEDLEIQVNKFLLTVPAEDIIDTKFPNGYTAVIIYEVKATLS